MNSTGVPSMLPGAKLVALAPRPMVRVRPTSIRRCLGLELRYQDDMGIPHAPSGARVAWFKDPDGNLLSVAEYAAG